MLEKRQTRKKRDTEDRKRKKKEGGEKKERDKRKLKMIGVKKIAEYCFSMQIIFRDKKYLLNN